MAKVGDDKSMGTKRRKKQSVDVRERRDKIFGDAEVAGLIGQGKVLNYATHPALAGRTATGGFDPRELSIYYHFDVSTAKVGDRSPLNKKDRIAAIIRMPVDASIPTKGSFIEVITVSDTIWSTAMRATKMAADMASTPSSDSSLRGASAVAGLAAEIGGSVADVEAATDEEEENEDLSGR